MPPGWSRKGWRVETKRRGGRVITCARRVWLPPGGNGGNGLPPKPPCAGGKLVVITTLPPRWSCVCPAGKKRIRIGQNAFVCKGGPGGDPGGDPGGGTDNAKKACIKKGWIWTGKICIVRERPRCPPGFFGRPPNCKKKIVRKQCPPGFIGWQPNCKKIFIKKKPADAPKKDVIKKDVKVRKDVKKAFETFKRRQKKD